jgi:hypothetical protein
MLSLNQLLSGPGHALMTGNKTTFSQKSAKAQSYGKA